MKLYILLLIILILCSLIIINKYYKNNNKTPFPIDIVYTWAGEVKSNNKRLSNNNELKFSLRSIQKFAPWVNKIHILMNSPKKKPSWFNDKYYKKINIVDHTDTFPSEFNFPNRNSNSIETTLHNIPSLSEHFIYFNDDVFLGKPVKYTDFFTPGGKAFVSHTVLNTRPMLNTFKKDILKIKYPPVVKQFYPHVPIVLLKSQLINFNKDYPDYVKWVRSNIIRVGNGCGVCTKFNLICPCAQQHHIIARYMYDNKKTVLKRYRKCTKNKFCNTMYVNGDHINLLNKILVDPPKFFCINDTLDQGNDMKRQHVRTNMNNFFEKFYPEVPFFEKQ